MYVHVSRLGERDDLLPAQHPGAHGDRVLLQTRQLRRFVDEGRFATEPH
ncbi:hypothetical protein ACPC54_36520 [Kitasatospora sp. NPDC094028]